jgi:2-polyprenyl-6-methoxyphenol hydroxylase-like FAD-dependent oxidoreductase
VVTVRSTSSDVIIIGAGPIGLAIAIELARAGFETLVVDKRPPPLEDPQLRSQLLVARRGDLANLAHLGVDIRDPWIVSPLATRCEADLASGRSVRGNVRALGVPARADLFALAAQPPVALVPIGRLQQALLAVARAHGAIVVYNCDATKLRRHATAVSLACADGSTVRGSLAIIATGAARSLIGSLRSDLVETPRRQLIGGVFAVAGKRGRWVRVELPVGFGSPARCTLLQSSAESKAGTGLLVEPQVTSGASPEQLAEAFDTAARVHGLGDAPFLVAPQVFPTAVTAMSRRFVAGDNRAAVIIAGDAAQTGHVFSGQTAFVNLALALSLCRRLAAVRTPIVEGAVMNAALLATLGKYDAESRAGAHLLATVSTRHVTMHSPGAWALAGVATLN